MKVSCSVRATSEGRSEEHTSELQSRFDLVCRLLLEKKNHQGAFRARVRQRFHQQKCIGFTALASRKIGAYSRIDAGGWCRRPSRETDAMDLDRLNV